MTTFRENHSPSTPLSQEQDSIFSVTNKRIVIIALSFQDSFLPYLILTRSNYEQQVVTIYKYTSSIYDQSRIASFYLYFSKFNR